MNYLNTGSQNILFQKVCKSPYFVDKSLLIPEVSKRIQTDQQYLCITRPRRFGKTVNLNMLGAYYTKGIDSHELFDELAVSDTEDYAAHRNQHNVIYIDFSRMPDECDTYKDYITDVRNHLKEDLAEAYPHLRGRAYSRLSGMLQDAGDSFLFLLEEWDSIFYKDFMTERDKAAYLEFLKGLLKDQPYVDLVYMTGVLPIAKYTSSSALNMFDEYNCMNDTVFDAYFGFYRGRSTAAL